jgi:hypothetical protein
LIVAQHDAGLIDEAKASAQRYLKVRPQASLQRYVETHPDKGGTVSKREFNALLASGLPL